MPWQARLDLDYTLQQGRTVLHSLPVGYSLDDTRAIRDGGGNGSIIGRNSFQRPREDALAMLAKLVDIYKNKA